MKNRRQMACWLVVVAAGLAGCSDQAKKLQLENQNLQKENAALKKDLATVLKSLENSLSFPDGWASRTLHQEELGEFEKPGAYESTHDVSLPDGNVLHMKGVSKVMFGNGGTCLVNAGMETQEGSAERYYALQVVTYDRGQQVYRSTNVFKDGNVSVSESRPEETIDGVGAAAQRKRKWRSVYTSNISEAAELETTVVINEARDEVEWNWAIKEDGETMVSGKGNKRRID